MKRILLMKVLLVVSLLICLACVAGPPNQTYSLPSGGACEVLTTPEPWLLKNYRVPGHTGLAGASGIDKTELREHDGKIAIAILSGLGRNLDETAYSTKKYVFDLADVRKIQAITEHEWLMAEPIDSEQKSVAGLPGSEYIDYGKNVDYQGKRFAASGDHLSFSDYAALPSPDGHWLALQSFDGKINPPGGMFGMFPHSGHFYVDVFDVDSGTKRFTLKGWAASGGVDEVPQKGTRWVHGKFLFLDFLDDKASFIVCDPTRRSG